MQDVLTYRERLRQQEVARQAALAARQKEQDQAAREMAVFQPPTTSNLYMKQLKQREMMRQKVQEHTADMVKAWEIVQQSIRRDQAMLLSGKAAFGSEASRRDYETKTQQFLDILKTPSSSANILATAIILAQADRGLTPVPANVYENVRDTAAGHGGVSIVASEDIIEKLLDLGCHAEVYVDQKGFGMVNIYDKNGKLVAKVTELSNADYVEKVAKKAGVDYNRWRYSPEKDDTGLPVQPGTFASNNVKLATGEWISKDDAEAIRNADHELYNILMTGGIKAYQTTANARIMGYLRDGPPQLREAYETGGIDAYTEAVEEYNKSIEVKERVRENIDNLNFEQELKDKPQILQEAYRAGGIEAYERARIEYNAHVDQLNKRINALSIQQREDQDYLWDELKDYTTVKTRGIEGTGYAPEVTREVDIIGYLRDTDNNQKAVNILTRAGFTSQDIKAAEQHIEYENDLADYRDSRGRYNLTQAARDAVSAETNVKELEIVDAVKGIFPTGTYDNFERMRQSLKYESKTWLDEGPWTKAYQEVQASAPWVFGFVSATKSTPVPHDDIVGALVLAGALGIAGVATIGKKNTGVNNIALVESLDDKLKSVSFIKPEDVTADQIEVVIPPRMDPVQREGYPKSDLKTPKEQVIPPKVNIDWEKITGQKNPSIILLDPAKTWKDIGVTGILEAQVATETAGTHVKQAVDTLGSDVPVYVKNKLRAIEAVKTVEAIESYLRYLSQNMSTHRQYDTIRIASDEYFQRLADLTQAKRVYVESVNPQPIKGSLNEETIEAVAGAKLLHELGVETKGMTASELRQALYNATAPQLKVASSIYENAYTKAVRQGLTRTQATTRAKQSVLTYIKTEILPTTATQALPATATQVLSKPGVKTKVITKTAELTKPVTLTTTAITTPATTTTTTTGTGIKLPRPSAGSSDKEHREFLKQTEGFVSYRRGALRGKGDQYNIAYYPYGPKDKMQLYGQPPPGAKLVRGKGSVGKSVKVIRGKQPTKPVFRDTGAVDDIISPSGKGVVIRSVQDKNVSHKPKYNIPSTIRTFDAGGGIETDKKGRGHIKL